MDRVTGLMDAHATPRYLADEMLGRLARWLRVLGHDTEWVAGIDDRELLDRAEREGRILLTRDTLLRERRAVRQGRVTVVFVPYDHLVDQLRYLREHEGLGWAGPPRCMVCDHGLEPLDPELARPRVPPYVAATQTSFHLCPACDRVVWRGTHWEHMIRTLCEAGFPPSTA